MVEKKASPLDAAGRRRLAEQKYEGRQRTASTSTEGDLQGLLHELQIHQIELEMQNEELRLAGGEFETLLEKYTDLYDFASVAYLTLDPRGKILEVNLFCCKLLGVERRELVNRMFQSFVAPPAHSLFNEFLAGIFSDPLKQLGELELLTEGEIPMTGQLQAIASSSGQTCRIALIDVTSQKAEEALRRTEKLAAFRVLTGSIAHDFNNLLAIVKGNLELLSRTLSDDEDAAPLLASAFKGVARGVKLTKSLLDFSRTKPRATTVVSVNARLAELTELITKALPVSFNLVIHPAEDLWPVEIDAEDFDNMLINLTLNARDAMPLGGCLTIETANKLVSAGQVKRCPQASVGDYVMITVRDTGTGMSAEVQARIFEPFFTTKEPDRGTGLGSSMVYAFVKRSGGFIEVSTVVDEGTTLRMYLPRSLGQVSEVRELTVPPKSPPRVTETILVVDDEPAMLELAITHLASLGYKTLAANNGPEALEVLARNRQINLLFTDMVMPAPMNGVQLAMAAHKRNPELKVILTSGYLRNVSHFIEPGEEEYITQLVNGMLQKPYSRDELAHALRRILDKRAAEPDVELVVIIDDDHDSLRIMDYMLRDNGVKNVLLFSDPAEVLGWLETGAPNLDLLLCDLNMFPVSGYEFAEQVSARFPAAAQNLFLISGNTSPPPSATESQRQLTIYPKPMTEQDAKSLLQVFRKLPG